MKVYRYPLTNEEIKEKTDEVSSTEIIENLENDSSLDFDITIDKSGDRHSRVKIEFDKDDLEAFHKGYISTLNDEIKNLKSTQEKLMSENTILKRKILFIKELLSKSNEQDLNFVIDYVKRFSVNSYLNVNFHLLPELNSNQEWISDVHELLLEKEDIKNEIDYLEI